MKRGILYLAHLLLVVIMTQITISAAYSSMNGEPDNNYQFSIHTPEHSIVSILLMKEKDETEHRLQENEIVLIELIDFTSHSAALSIRHNTRLRSDFNEISHQPPLFTLHQVFLI